MRVDIESFMASVIGGAHARSHVNLMASNGGLAVDGRSAFLDFSFYL